MTDFQTGSFFYKELTSNYHDLLPTYFFLNKSL